GGGGVEAGDAGDDAPRPAGGERLVDERGQVRQGRAALATEVDRRDRAEAALTERLAVSAEQQPPGARAAGVDAQHRLRARSDPAGVRAHSDPAGAGSRRGRPSGRRPAPGTAGASRWEAGSGGRSAPPGPRRAAVSQPAATAASKAEARPRPSPAPALTPALTAAALPSVTTRAGSRPSARSSARARPATSLPSGGIRSGLAATTSGSGASRSEERRVGEGGRGWG